MKSTTIIQLKGDQICEDQQELKSIVDELLPGNDFETPNSPILPEFPSSTQPSPSDRRSAILLLSRRYRQFEQLTRSIATIPAVRKAAEQKPANVKDMSWKKTVKSACDACALETEPLLRDWLKPPRSELAVAGRAAASFIRSERSSTDLQTALDAYLRAVYLPELILALNRVYVYAANYVTRDLLPPALDLASTIASPEAELAACFAASGRLPELAAALARGSRQFMAADALQGRDRPREQFRGVKHRLGMWRVRLEEEQGSGERRNAFAERARRGEPGARLSAFGHGLEVDLRTQAPIVAE